MPESGLSGLMSGVGKRGVGQRPELPRPSSTEAEPLQSIILADANTNAGLRHHQLMRPGWSLRNAVVASVPRCSISVLVGALAPSKPHKSVTSAM
jgi:hypothetical protein